MQNPTMGRLVVAGLQELQTLFGAHDQFVGHVCNVSFRYLMFVNRYGTAARLLSLRIISISGDLLNVILSLIMDRKLHNVDLLG